MTGGRRPEGNLLQDANVNIFQELPSCADILYGLITITLPPFFKLTVTFGGLCWCHHVIAHMRSLIIIKFYSLGKGPSDLLDTSKPDIVQEFVLNGKVYSFGYGVVFGVAVLGHAYFYISVLKNFNILFRCILKPPVTMMD